MIVQSHVERYEIYNVNINKIDDMHVHNTHSSMRDKITKCCESLGFVRRPGAVIHDVASQFVGDSKNRLTPLRCAHRHWKSGLSEVAYTLLSPARAASVEEWRAPRSRAAPSRTTAHRAKSRGLSPQPPRAYRRDSIGIETSYVRLEELWRHLRFKDKRRVKNRKESH